MVKKRALFGTTATGRTAAGQRPGRKSGSVGVLRAPPRRPPPPAMKVLAPPPAMKGPIAAESPAAAKKRPVPVAAAAGPGGGAPAAGLVGGGAGEDESILHVCTSENLFAYINLPTLVGKYTKHGMHHQKLHGGRPLALNG